jgi:hypothetical protein
MFNKNDPLIDSVNEIIKENQAFRDAANAVNEEFGIAGKRDLPFQVHAEYDALVEEMKQEALVGKQQKLDVNRNNRLDKHDFKMLRGMKKKPMEEGKMKDIATAQAEKERLAKKVDVEKEVVQERVGPAPAVVRSDQMKRAGDMTTSRQTTREPTATSMRTPMGNPRVNSGTVVQPKAPVTLPTRPGQQTSGTVNGIAKPAAPAPKPAGIAKPAATAPKPARGSVPKGMYVLKSNIQGGSGLRSDKYIGGGRSGGK